MGTRNREKFVRSKARPACKAYNLAAVIRLSLHILVSRQCRILNVNRPTRPVTEIALLFYYDISSVNINSKISCIFSPLYLNYLYLFVTVLTVVKWWLQTGNISRGFICLMKGRMSFSAALKDQGRAVGHMDLRQIAGRFEGQPPMVFLVGSMPPHPYSPSWLSC
jgi:hypothetical protein